MTNIIKGLGKCIINSIYTSLWVGRKIKKGTFHNFLPKNQNNNKLTILANGPSLRSVLKKMKKNDDTDYCAVNFFGNLPEFQIIRPLHYVLADPIFFSKEEKLSSDERKLMESLNNIDWLMNIYVPFPSYKIIVERISNEKIKIIPFPHIPYEGWEKMKLYLFKKGLSMPRAQNVLIPSIFIGINEGYKTIELYGVDHSWTPEIRVDINNQVCVIQKHFYDKDNLKLAPWHRGKGKPVYKMHEILRDLAWMFDGYHQLRKYADAVGCKIINKTEGSFIDAFERE